jgi:hypothetical protein
MLAMILSLPPQPAQRATSIPAPADIYRMICRRALAAGIKTRIGNRPFRAMGITQYLRNGGRRELEQHMAAHESPRTTAPYDRSDDEVAVDEVERIMI